MDVKKITAVDYLVESIFNESELIDSILKLAIQQAKAMEKQQTIDFTNDYLNDDEYLTPEHYYNETYNK